MLERVQQDRIVCLCQAEVISVLLRLQRVDRRLCLVLKSGLVIEPLDGLLGKCCNDEAERRVAQYLRLLDNHL